MYFSIVEDDELGHEMYGVVWDEFCGPVDLRRNGIGSITGIIVHGAPGLSCSFNFAAAGLPYLHHKYALVYKKTRIHPDSAVLVCKARPSLPEALQVEAN